MEVTIGFDLRSTVADPSWTAERRTVYLLRHDVASVRSVDADAWVRPPGLPPAPRTEPEHVGLWPHLTDLLAAARGLDLADAVTVRITVLDEDAPTLDTAGPFGAGSATYHLLGYDVADYYLMSGLANCGYSPAEEAASLAPDWAPRLNEWHLFRDPADATAFAAVTAERVPEHAPFFAYGIYQLR
jgi:hypothetical protein